jgi:hypothetical protein
MTRAARFALLALVIALPLTLATPAGAFNVLSFDGRNIVKWRSSHLPLHYEVQANFPATPGTDDEAAIAAAVASWQNVTCSSLTFAFDGYTAGNTIVARDGRNRIVYTTQGFTTTASGAIGVTYTEFSGDSRGWYISGGDIAINAYTSWSTSPGRSQFDLESVVVHELGHLIGLQHTPVLAATMYFAVGPGDTSQRSLHDDDRSGGCFLYPAGTFRCTSNADCPTLESNDTDAFGNPHLWGRSTCQPDGTCALTGAPPGDPIGSTCAGPADCASGLCIPSPTVENNVCSQACDANDETSCPAGFTCLDYPDEFGDVCIAEGTGALGDPCESGLDCASAVCVGLSETEAECSEICNPTVFNSCPLGSLCFESMTPGVGYCIAGGDTPFGEACESSFDCEGVVCLVFEEDAESGLCTQMCHPSNPGMACPAGAGCWPSSVEGEYLCVPGGDGPPGSRCESFLDCQNALCVPYDASDTNYRCGLACEFRPGVNDCPGGFECFPLDIGGVCLPKGDVPLGGHCETIFDCESLLCLAVDDVCTELCTASCPTGFECVPLTGGFGGCISDGTIPGDDTGTADVGGDDVGGTDNGGDDVGGGGGDNGEPDAGGEDDLGGGGGGGGGRSGDDDGCSTVGGGAQLGGWLLFALGVLVLGRRTTRGRRSH